MKPKTVTDHLKAFTASHGALTKELERLVQQRDRLVQQRAVIDARINEIRSVPGLRRIGFGTPRAGNILSLRKAVAQVTKDKPLTKPEILNALEKIGYKFTATNPMNSLNAALYTPGWCQKMGEGTFQALEEQTA